jgi:glutathione synthase
MALKVAVQMDHISTVNIAGDTTFALSLEAQKRGHELYHYTPDRLSMRDGVVSARLEKMEVRDIKGDHYTLGEPIRRDLSEMDVVLLRQDPPFDMIYITHDPSAGADSPENTRGQRSGMGAQQSRKNLRDRVS